jgi:hypothetical protein
METLLEVPSEILKIENIKVDKDRFNGALLLVLEDRFLLLNVLTFFVSSCSSSIRRSLEIRLRLIKSDPKDQKLLIVSM